MSESKSVGRGLGIFSLIFFLLFAGSAASPQNPPSIETSKQQEVERVRNYHMSKDSPTGKLNSATRNLSSAQALLQDTDDDGMPDAWESAHGLNPNNPDDAWLDPDSDAVVNLFEYQLGSDPNDAASPPKATVGASGANYTSVAIALNSVAAGTVIRVAGGSYPLNYYALSPKIVMIQGGWSPNFSQRDLHLYPTTFDGQWLGEILYVSVSSGNSSVILDGLRFVRGKGYLGAVNLLAQGTAIMTTSVLNCLITTSQSDFGFGGVLNMFNWDSSTSDRTIANTIVGGNASSGIYSQNTGTSLARWRIINTTISRNLNGGGSNGRGIDAFTLDSALLTSHVYNSIAWGNASYDIDIRRNVTFDADHSDVASVSAGSATYRPGLGLMNVDAQFVCLDSNDFHLTATSPLINTGTNQGLPVTDFEGDPRKLGGTADIGADEQQNSGANSPIRCISPAFTNQGTTISAILSGTGLTGTTAVTFSGAGVTAVINSGGTDTSLPITIMVAANAAPGPRTITVTVNGVTSAPFSSFIVNDPPVITFLSPASGLQGSTVNASITGSNLAGATAVTFSGTGVTGTLGGGPAISPRPITIMIAPDAVTGLRTVTITAGVTSAPYSGFTVNSSSKRRGQLTSN